jgi:hypothetical protein
MPSLQRGGSSSVIKPPVEDEVGVVGEDLLQPKPPTSPLPVRWHLVPGGRRRGDDASSVQFWSESVAAPWLRRALDGVMVKCISGSKNWYDFKKWVCIKRWNDRAAIFQGRRRF